VGIFSRRATAKGWIIMKKIIMLMVFVAPILAGCMTSKCETEPIVAENHKLIVPPNFGNMPK